MFDRETRNLQNKKQTDIQIKTGGVPSAGDIRGLTIKYINGHGLYLIAKYNGKVAYLGPFTFNIG